MSITCVGKTSWELNTLFETEPLYLPGDCLSRVFDFVPLHTYPSLRWVCRRWWHLWRARRKRYQEVVLEKETMRMRKQTFVSHVFPNGRKHGKSLTYRNSEEWPFQVAEYWDGVRDGETTFFFTGMDKPTPRLLIPYSNDHKNGVELEWNLHGTLIHSVEWLNDQKHGWERWFSANGQPLSEVQWWGNLRHGVARQWSEGGVLLLPEKWYLWGEGLKGGHKEFLRRRNMEPLPSPDTTPDTLDEATPGSRACVHSPATPPEDD